MDRQLADQLAGRARQRGLQLVGEGGLSAHLTEQIVESALEGEMDDHLGYGKHDPAGRKGGNSRNGARSKTLITSGRTGAGVGAAGRGRVVHRVMDGLASWQSRPLDPVIFIDAINVKIRDGNVANRSIYIALAVTVDGHRDILGLWAGDQDSGEGAKFWIRVLSKIKNRGTTDVCMLVCDGLTGLPDAGNTVWPRTITQTCVVS